MKLTQTTVLILALILAASSFGGAAQSSPQTSQDQSAKQSQPGMTHQAMMGAGMMGQMTAHHQQMSTLMNKLMQSMAAIQNEKDPAALKSKLAEHNALLKEMHDQMMQQGNMMRSMSDQVRANCPAAVDSGKTPSK